MRIKTFYLHMYRLTFGILTKKTGSRETAMSRSCYMRFSTHRDSSVIRISQKTYSRRYINTKLNGFFDPLRVFAPSRELFFLKNQIMNNNPLPFRYMWNFYFILDYSVQY